MLRQTLPEHFTVKRPVHPMLQQKGSVMATMREVIRHPRQNISISTRHLPPQRIYSSIFNPKIRPIAIEIENVPPVSR